MKYLPYQQLNTEEKHLKQYKFLKRKFLPSLKVVDQNHYLLLQKPKSYLSRIEKLSNKHNYFLKVDVKKYFPSVKHELLANKVVENYKLLLKKRERMQGNEFPPTLKRRLSGNLPLLSRRFKKLLNKKLPELFESTTFKGQGLPIGNALSYLLAGVFLLDFDLSVKQPYLRYNDDYLFFFKSKEQPENFLQNKVLSSLEEHKLQLNTNKVRSGKIHKQPIKFLGFKFKAGHFTVQQEKIQNFKKKVRKVTDLRHEKEPKQVIEKLNDKILGFGHYYKHASCKNDFKNLDAFVRKRLRRYITRSRSYEKLPNLTLTNSQLKEMGLKSLVSIKDTFDQKGHKSTKSSKPKAKSGKDFEGNFNQLSASTLQLQQKLMLERFDELTGSLEELQKKVDEIEEKLNQQKLL